MPLGPGSSALTPTMLSPPRVPARLATVRRQFDARAHRFATAAVLPREIARRMIERLEYIRLVPQQILDVGCGAGETQAALHARYPRAHWTGVDISERMLQNFRLGAHARGLRWLRRVSIGRVVADGGRLPIADGRVDLLFSNLMLHWHPEPHTVFPEWKRVMKVEGLLMFSCFGPDTLKELRAAATAALPHACPMPFIDMHDFGDMMVASGFATPVMDAEIITLTYQSPHALLREARLMGGNPRDDRAQRLPSSRQVRDLLHALEAQRASDGRIALTFEVAYGHAWKPQAKSVAAATVSLDVVRAELASRKRDKAVR